MCYDDHDDLDQLRSVGPVLRTAVVLGGRLDLPDRRRIVWYLLFFYDLCHKDEQKVETQTQDNTTTMTCTNVSQPYSAPDTNNYVNSNTTEPLTALFQWQDATSNKTKNNRSNNNRYNKNNNSNKRTNNSRSEGCQQERERRQKEWEERQKERKRREEERQEREELRELENQRRQEEREKRQYEWECRQREKEERQRRYEEKKERYRESLKEYWNDTVYITCRYEYKYSVYDWDSTEEILELTRSAARELLHSGKGGIMGRTNCSCYDRVRNFTWEVSDSYYYSRPSWDNA